MPGNAIENRRSFVFRALLFFLFQLLPLGPDGVHRLGVAFSEDMRVTMNEFVDDPLGDLLEVEVVSFFTELAVEDHLEEQVAEFFDHLLVVVGFDGVDELVDFLNGVESDAHVILFSVPWAAFGRTQRSHDFQELIDRRLIFAWWSHGLENDEIVAMDNDFAAGFGLTHLLGRERGHAAAEFGSLEVADGNNIVF